MASVNSRMSAERLVDVYGLYTADRLAVDPDAAEVKARWDRDQERLRQADADWREAVRNRLRARARRDWEERDLRNRMRSFANRTIEAGSGSRNTAIHRTYFPEGFGAAARGSLENLIEESRSILTRLQGESDETLIKAGEELQKSLESAEPVEAAWIEVSTLVRTKRDALEAAKIAWIGAYRRVQGELTVLHPQDRQFVASFFYRRTRRKKPTPETAPTPVGDESANGSLNGNGRDPATDSRNPATDAPAPA